MNKTPRFTPRTIPAQAPAPVPVAVVSRVSAPKPTVLPRRQTKPMQVPNLAPEPQLVDRSAD
jgi:hypothetical protein